MADRRVRWNGEEKLILRRRVQELLADGIERPLDAVRSAQNVLPRGRRREILHVGQVSWLFQAPGGHAMALAPHPLATRGATAAAVTLFGSLPGREAVVDMFAGVLRDALMRLVSSGEWDAISASEPTATMDVAAQPATVAASKGSPTSRAVPVPKDLPAPETIAGIRLKPARRTAAR